MKRIMILTAATVILAVAFVTKVLAQSSVPNLLNFQGKLTTSGGSPVADGPHNFTFRIYDALVGGILRWSEGPVSLTTSGGLFNHQLGSGVAFTQTLFQDFDELYLEIEADGEIQTPRVRLISSPYTRTAGGLEARTSTNDTVVIRTVPNAAQISTYGFDGKEQIRLWGGSYGEILLHDADATNDLTAKLTANSSSGGELELNDDNGNLTIDLVGGGIGDASVVVPNNAINSLETEDEPGVASNQADGFVSPIAVTNPNGQTLLSRLISAPAAGYVLAIATGNIFYNHTNGTPSIGVFGVSDVAGSLPVTQQIDASIPINSPTALYTKAVTVHGLFSVSAGFHIFYFIGAGTATGGVEVWDRQLTLVYFPTSYGTVVPTAAAASGGNIPAGKAAAGSALTAAEQAEAEQFNAARIERELTQVKAEMETRMQKLEEQLQQNQKAIDNKP